MNRTLLTGGSSFLAAHVLDLLLARGHSVRVAVRSPSTAVSIKEAYPLVAPDKLDFAIAEHSAAPDAFHNAVISDPPFQTVIHTAGPHLVRRKMENRRLDRSPVGSTGILEEIKKNAPSVKRVVITSSFCAMVHPNQITSKKYSEADWNHFTRSEVGALENPKDDYQIRENAMAERAAWDFVEKERPKFTLTSCILPLVFGPMMDLDQSISINHCSKRVRDFMMGASKEACPPTNGYFFVDVRDAALSHVLAAEKKEAEGKRFFIVADKFCNKQIAEIIGKKLPQVRDRLPTGEALKAGDFPVVGMPDFDNRRSVEVLGMTYRSFADSIEDTVKSWQRSGPVRRTDISKSGNPRKIFMYKSLQKKIRDTSKS